ncbi:MAG: RagB/SusD family nutrient uptake outer membrane protein [Bacteroidota bacterium]
MKNNSKIYLFALVLGILAILPACEVDLVVDPNNPSLGSVTNDASKAEMQTLITGLEARHRVYFDNATEMFGSFGREIWAFFASDPRFLDDWLGRGISETYPDFFASAGTFVSPYLAVKQANVINAAADASSTLTAEEVNAYKGFANTVKAHQLLYPLLQQFQNGIRIDVDDPLNPGAIVDYDVALSAIRSILDEGFSQLNSAGDELPFTLTGGYAGFDTPDGLASVNRAIAARAAIYAEDYAGASAALANSFMNMEGDLMTGPAHVYGEAPDINNPLFYPFDRATNTILIVHPSMIEDAIPGDNRLNKFAERVDNPVTNTGLTGTFQDARWPSNTSPIAYIRNEELILIAAEAAAQTGDTDGAVAAINVVRNAAGIGDYEGGTSAMDLMDEILFQRRYSLWAEGGHRWVDLRRTGRLNGDNVDLRDGGSLFTQVARRTSESN